MSTRTLLEKEAKGNSEMAFSIMLMMGITMRKIRRIITGTVMILKFTKGDRGDKIIMMIMIIIWEAVALAMIVTLTITIDNEGHLRILWWEFWVTRELDD